MSDNKNKRLNSLALEKSPYLLQHADNPVDWHPWSDDAFKKAVEQDKPVFLSIGYSTCHWCHVMAHESFEDEQVARLLNEAFVCIKVDREERPDIDKIYMAVCQMMTGSGGWPLTIILTPDRKPFFAATYIPRETRFGRIGLLELVPRLQEVWKNRRSEVLASAEQVAGTLLKMDSPEKGNTLAEPVLHRAFEQLREAYDPRYGGFGSAPKFPTPHNTLFLLRYWKRTGNSDALDMVENTLQRMRNGGIYDHMGYGFHRYSTDSRWLVPHFEKMLYDQALCAEAYLEAFQATGKEEYARAVREIFTYILRDMRGPEGGFYSAEDADSEGEEGKYYLWTEDEIRSVLTEDEADLVYQVFNVTGGGNYSDEIAGGKTGHNILYITEPLSGLASTLGLPLDELQNKLEAARGKMFEYRKTRIRPHLDDKILTDWNALMIAILAKGARVLRDDNYTEAAQWAYEFLMGNLRTDNGELLHRYRDGEAAVAANLDDYAFLINAQIELYETTFDAQYLHDAIDLNEHLIEHFRDNDNGGFFFTADDAERLLSRQKEVYDGAVPSGNSIAMMNLLRLSRITADSRLEQMASDIGETFSGIVNRQPGSFTRLLSAVDFAVGPSYEVVIAGNTGAPDTKEMIEALNKKFIPGKVVIFRTVGGETPEIDDLCPFAVNHGTIDGKATAYVCSGFSCHRPTTEIDAMLSLITGSH